MNAEKEVELAIERLKKSKEDCDGENEYVINCYKSALKAYKCLEEDGHSGMSWGITKSILIRLMNDCTLNPITEEDEFRECDWKELGEQCVRHSALYRKKQTNGTYKYSDSDRVVLNDGWHSGLATDLVDELFPITLPYSPSPTRYKVIGINFSTDGRRGYFDTEWFKEVKTPEGKIIPINRYYKEAEDGWKQISKEEYDKRFKQFVSNATEEWLNYLGFDKDGNELNKSAE